MERCAQQRDDCRFVGTDECMVTTHHLYYPSNEYTTKVERFFRELPHNKERLRRCDHMDRHANEEPPEHPSVDFMVGFIIGSEVHIPASVRKIIRGISYGDD